MKKEKKTDIQPLKYITVLYTLVMVLGLYVGTQLIKSIQQEEILPAVANPDAPESALYIFFYILIMTGVLLVLIKLNLDLVIKLVAFIAFFGGIVVTLSSIFQALGILFAVLLMAATLWKRQNIMLLNLSLILTVAGVGAFLGASLSVLPSLLLLVILSIYDIVAVFWTKHMVTLAEKAKGRLPFMFLIPYKGRDLGLGTGDMAIPLVFTVSVFKDYAITNALLTAAGGLVGIISLFLYIQNRRRITLPALPPLTIGLIAGFAISLIPRLLL